MTQLIDPSAESETRTPRRRGMRPKTAKQVRVELARLYDDALNGRIEMSKATKLAFMLEVLRRAIATDEIERRLELLERMKGELR
ncbi:hypothetical protein [Burkholderia ubonensis]|uniref:hypothetical protein n=1 Tax=Burkholderia ubonensis TaxID=101571 RepID=UPI0012F84CAC|nr:hypothetical protein [Burkholderia ubonensis]